MAITAAYIPGAQMPTEFGDDQLQIDGRMVDLSPGVAVTVEIKTGSRQVIEYLLAPLLRFRQDSLRDR